MIYTPLILLTIELLWGTTIFEETGCRMTKLNITALCGLKKEGLYYNFMLQLEHLLCIRTPKFLVFTRNLFFWTKYTLESVSWSILRESLNDVCKVSAFRMMKISFSLPSNLAPFL